MSKTLANLRATPKLKKSPTKATQVAGLPAKVFDATVTAIDRPGAGGLSINPFTINHHCGFCEKTDHRETKDTKVGLPGQLFRIIVLRAQGRTVVIYVESTYAGSKKHPPSKTLAHLPAIRAEDARPHLVLVATPGRSGIVPEHWPKPPTSRPTP